LFLVTFILSLDVKPEPLTASLNKVVHVLNCNEALHNLHSSPSLVRMIKSRRMRWAGHEARMGENWNANRILVGKLEEKGTTGKTKT
jgi:hypothetical protein